MSDFMCWDPEEGTAEEAGVTIVKASSPEWAAERFVERGWEGEEFPRVVHVQDERGGVTCWSVIAVPSVDFRATPIAAKGAA